MEPQMFTRTDLDTLMADASSDAISFYLPTHVQGAEVRGARWYAGRVQFGRMPCVG